MKKKPFWFTYNLCLEINSCRSFERDDIYSKSRACVQIAENFVETKNLPIALKLFVVPEIQ